MGGCLNRKSEDASEKEKPIPFRSYASSADDILSVVENKYNLMQYLNLSEYLFLLSNFTCDPNEGLGVHEKDISSPTDKSYMFYLPKALFSIFVENKILKHFLIYKSLGEEEDIQRIFKAVFVFVYGSLHLKLNNITKKRMEHLKKLHLIPIGFLYCSGSNTVKIRFLYNLFVDDNEFFSQSEELDEFVLSIILISSYCMLYARNKLGELKESKISIIASEEKFVFLDEMEEKDIVRLKDMFMKDFFKGKKSLTCNEFEENFQTREFDWLLSSAGVRYNLEKFNDAQTE